MHGDTIYAKTIEVKNTFIPYGVSKIICGITALIFSIPALVKIKNIIKSQLLGSDLNHQELIIIALMIAAFFILYWLIWGSKSIILGVKNLGRLVVPPNTPPEFKDYREVERALVKREMSVYRMPSSGPIALARKFISEKVPFLTERTRLIVEMNISFVRRLLVFILFVSIVIYLSDFIPPEFYRENQIPAYFIAFPFIFFLLLVGAGTLKILSLFSLLPQTAPTSDVKEELLSLNGAGDPNGLPAEIERSLLQLRTQGMPNRAYRSGFDIDGSGVQDTGKIKGKLFIETQPVSIERDPPGVIYLFLGFGIAFLILAQYILTSVPQFYTTIQSHQTVEFLTFLWSTIKAITYGIIGAGFLSQAHFILGTFRYDSHIFFIDLEGTYGRSEIKAGKAISDSFETSNTVIRSDCQIRVYSSKIASENYTLEGVRHITGMVIDKNASESADLVRESLIDFQKKGVSVRGIDVGSESIQDIAKANIIYHQQKKVLKSGDPTAKLNNIERSDSNKRLENNSMTNSLPESENNAETKECPECAEIIKAKARKCRFCGYRFDDIE